MKKDGGRIDKYITFMISLLLTAIITVILVLNMGLLQCKIDINQIARQYILRMETVGYLTADDRNEMVDKLTELGVTDISLAGTTTVPVEYGSDIHLKFTGNLHYEKIEIPELLSPVMSVDVIPIREERESTAKN